jgi:N-acetylmuramoyl-L-alanine amidase
VKGKVDAFDQRAVPAAPVLQRGSTGPAVRALQQRLVRDGFMAQADFSTGPGVYGPRTEQAVRRLQEAVGLQVTGVVGPTTHQVLASATRFAPRKPAPPPPDIMATQPIPVEEVRAHLALTDGEDAPGPPPSPL